MLSVWGGQILEPRGNARRHPVHEVLKRQVAGCRRSELVRPLQRGKVCAWRPEGLFVLPGWPVHERSGRQQMRRVPDWSVHEHDWSGCRLLFMSHRHIYAHNERCRLHQVHGRLHERGDDRLGQIGGLHGVRPRPVLERPREHGLRGLRLRQVLEHGGLRKVRLVRSRSLRC